MFRKMILFMVGLLIMSCQSEQTKEKTVEEIRSESLIGNAAIVRNPISANTPKDTINVAKMSFEQTVYDFGEVEAGEVIVHTFEFENTGRVPLVITDARSTCGCTVPEYPEEMIYPGDKGKISVRFNTTNMLRAQRKPVIITANTFPSETKVYLNGYVHSK